jgi:iron complex outermembrane recepter protein
MRKLMRRVALVALVSGGASAQSPQTVQTATPAENPPATRDAASSDRVIVTARRREELVQDVPAAVTGLSAQQLEAAGGVKDVKDLSYLLPGLSFVDTGNINAENNIRGAGAGTARTAGVDSPIAVLRDGASITGGTIGGRTFARQDLFDLARVEVTRGPQGALYGVNAVGGVMQAISQRPKTTPGASVSTTWSPDIDRIAIDAIGNIPIGDTMGLRVGVQRAQRDKGFFLNTFTRDYSDVEHYTGYKGSFVWTPSDDISIFLVADGSSDTGASNFIRSVNRQNDPTVVPTTVGPADIDGPFVHSMNSSNETDRDISNYNASIEWRTALGTLTSTTLYRERNTVFRQDSDLSAPGYATPPFPAATCATRLCTTNFLDHTELTGEELRLAGEFGPALSWIVGGNIQGRQSEFATVVDGRTTSAANLAPSPTANLSSTAKEEELQTGAFASLSWEATEALTIDGAVRYNNSEKKTDAYTIQRGPATGATSCIGIYTDPFNAPGLRPDCLRTRNILGETFSTTAPSLSAKYEINDNLRVFASAGIGYRAGGFNANSVLDPQITPTYEPEKNTAYEAGAKFEMLGAFFTLTGFMNQFDDLLVTIDTLGPDNVSRNSRFNAGEAKTYGVDLEAFGRTDLPTGWGALDYNGAVNYLTGEIETGPYAGRTVEGSPEWTYTGTLTYRKPVFDAFRFIASTSYRGQRGGYTNTTNINNQVHAPDLDLWNASLGLEADNWRFTVEARNLFDETYESLRDPTRSVYGDPREIRFTLGFFFGSEERRSRRFN